MFMASWALALPLTIGLWLRSHLNPMLFSVAVVIAFITTAEAALSHRRLDTASVRFRFTSTLNCSRKRVVLLPCVDMARALLLGVGEKADAKAAANGVQEIEDSTFLRGP